VSIPESIEYATADGESAHAFLYHPANPGCRGGEDERPPLLVKSHGGPTSAATTALDLSIQFWTSRGFAVVDVNYRGSSGFGRAYRDRLRGEWGVLDVSDCVDAARAVASRGSADALRLAIRGSSAGGYTTLCALAFHDVFRAGASYYGIGDLEALARDTHKFEARYLDRLVGPYPERRDLYVARSPLHFAERISCPAIFFQGLEDPVVPPNQAEAMVDALAARGIPHAYVPFAGERHGFRRAESLRKALEAELYFYAKVFGFPVEVRPSGVDIVGIP
jgi:dipeptidyl aminopeptidase/acylaminoacyl peptidase